MFAYVVAALVALLTIVAEAFGARSRWTPGLWGANAWAFLPIAAFVIAVVALGAALALLARAAWRPGGEPDDGSARGNEPSVAAPAWRGWLVRGAAALAAFGMLWVLRERHLFLGDGFVLADSIPRSDGLHNFEPVMAYLQHAIWRVTGPWFAGHGAAAADVGARTAALGSAVAGALFTLVLIPLAGEIVRAATGHAPDRRMHVLVVAAIATQGFVELFFGYVENYAWLALGLAYFLYTSLAYVNRRGALLPVLVSFYAALSLHLSAVALAPAAAVLIVWGLLRGETRAAALGDLVAGGVMFAVFGMLIAMAGGGYDLGGTVMLVTRLVLSGRGDPHGYLLSARHFADLVNECLLIGPIAVPLFVAGAALAVPRLFAAGGLTAPGSPVRPRVAVVWALTLGGAWLAAVALAGDSNLGYARNWDLLAPAALVLTVAGAVLLLASPLAARPRRFVLAALVAVSVFHTAPWVAVNASFARSFARFKTLPLGGGRTESTVGYWYATHGDLDDAEWWLERALEQNPANSRAQYLLGKVWMSTRHYAQAVAAFSAARLERPDLDVFRVALVDALFRAQQGAAALSEVDTLLEHDPRAARFWAIRGVILLGLERRDDARVALERARTLEPDVAVYRTLESQAAATGAGEQLAMRWDELVAQ